MKNKTIAIIGIGSYLLSVISSATDLQGNFVSPILLIAISGIATIVFVVMATIRLWKEERYLSIMLASSQIILTILMVIQEITLPKYGNPIIVLLNITKVVNLIVFIWVIIKLFKKKNDKSPSKTELNNQLEMPTEKEMEKLGEYLIFIEKYIEAIYSTQNEIETKIEKIKTKTQQNLKEEQLIKELWVLRYALLHLWFFNLKPPKNQNELIENITLINHAFKQVKYATDFLPWLKKGFIEFSGTDQLTISNLKDFEQNVLDKVTEKISLIAFDCTEGRLGGELHDFIIELLMTTVEQDKKVFETGNNSVPTEDETSEIKKIIEEMSSSRKKASKEFFEELLNKLRWRESY